MLEIEGLGILATPYYGKFSSKKKNIVKTFVILIVLR